MMSPEILFFIFIGTLIVLLLMGQWIAFSLGLSGMILLFIKGGTKAFIPISSLVWNNSNSYILISIPLFVFMGEVILQSGASRYFYDGVGALLYKFRGALLYTNIVACAIFAAISGSSVATAVTIGTVAYPEMTRKGYHPKLVIGSLAAGGTLGILIPPSIIMILYGALVQESVAKLFMAGFIPGIILALLFMANIRLILSFKQNKNMVPANTEGLGMSLQEWLRRVVHVLPMVALASIVISGIWTGWTTPTEAAAVGCVGALILAAGYRGLKFEVFKIASLTAVRTSCFLLFIVINSQILSLGLNYSGITRAVSDWLLALGLSKWMFFLALVILYAILGCLVDGITMIYITLPVLFPAIVASGFNTIWFGVVLTILIEMGQITPPVGVNLFAIQGLTKHPLGEVSKSVIGYIFAIFIMVTIMAFFPKLALWLPSKM